MSALPFGNQISSRFINLFISFSQDIKSNKYSYRNCYIENQRWSKSCNWWVRWLLLTCWILGHLFKRNLKKKGNKRINSINEYIYTFLIVKYRNTILPLTYIIHHNNNESLIIIFYISRLRPKRFFVSILRP